MGNLALRVEHLAKRYRIGAVQNSYKTLRESIMAGAKTPLSWLSGDRKNENTFWALDDISFQINQGEAVGIIGRNGAGKSTLLKILSRITKPTRGRVEFYGQVGSLLEVGTGFHPELTGRENIYLNGAILGMGRAEIDRKFDEIVDFAELEKFLDTPVKFYSSGMYVRLAFAVAANLEPEILIVDEVLAVGDAEFQKKCLGKMDDVTNTGRTVLFVSHNLQAVRQLCQRGIYLAAGKIVIDSTAEQAIDTYSQSIPTVESAESLEEIIRNLPPDPVFRLYSIALSQKGQPVSKRVLNGLPLEISIEFEVLQTTIGLRIYFDLRDVEGNILFRSFHDGQSVGIPKILAGRYISRTSIPSNFLALLNYDLLFFAGIYNVRMCLPDGIRVPIVVEAAGDQQSAYVADLHHGKLEPILDWKTDRV